ncbi:unnamed protein product [Symbiodinium sp. CCMP2456]|nr:unnamed protein product [Symbiodinium sp. CCMP2456]
MVVFSAAKVEFVGSLSWVRSPVHEGNFAVESDRKVCSQVVRTAVDTYLAHLRDNDKAGNLFRYFAGRYESFSGLSPPARSLEDFLQAFRFPSLDSALKQRKGIGAVACAAMSGDVGLLRQLVEMKAPLDTKLQGLWEVALPVGSTPVIIAATCGKWGHAALKEMLKLKADPNSACAAGGAALCFCTTPEGVELLVSHGADVNLRNPPAKCSGLCGQLIRGGDTKTCAKLLELRADVSDSDGGLGQTPLQYLLLSYSDNAEGLETAKKLVKARADVNKRGKSGGVFRPLTVACRTIKLARKNPSLLVSYMAEMSTTALGTACYYGIPEMVKFLLAARADLDIRNDRGRPAYALARHESIQEILNDWSRSGGKEWEENLQAWELSEEPGIEEEQEEELIRVTM